MSRAGENGASLANSAIGELLCLAAEEPSRTDQQRRALRRAGRAAFRWPIEAAQLLADNRPLTELRWVGPWLARQIGDWLRDPPEVPTPPPVRRGFLSRPEVDAVLAQGDGAKPVAGDLQTHTLDSDGTASLRDMATAALGRGLAYLAITDHSKGLAIAHGMDEARLAAQGEEIERLNSELGERQFRVLRAVEMNLSPTGDGDLDPQFAAGLEVVLGAFHSRLRVREDQTERYLAALRNPSFDVLAHPRGRIFNFREGLTADWARVFEAAREHDKAIEIDGYPDRQDLDRYLLRLARDAGVRISIGSDAHAPSQLAFLSYGIAAARDVGIADERIINCMSADALLAWTASHRR